MRKLLLLLAATTAFAQTAYQSLARDVLKELIEINTTDTTGDNTRAAVAVATRFRKAGYPEADVKVLGPQPRKGNVVVRLRGTGSAKPVLFIGHLDVVEALRSDWSVDPFRLTEEGGFFFGRGSQDTKGNDAMMVAAFLRMKQENFRPSRDLILALTADEEGGPANGIDWLVTQHRDLIDAEYCINTDGGGGLLKNGKPVLLGMDAAEKIYLSFKLEVTDSGGHSSLPTKDNPIFRLSDALSRLGKFDFPVHLFDVSRSYFESSASLEGGQDGEDMKRLVQNPNDPAVIARLSATPRFNATLRTTCVATQLSGGHAENALPQLATATVNCRILPVEKPDDIQKMLEGVLADPTIKISRLAEPVLAQQKPMDPNVLKLMKDASQKIWPGVPMIISMSTGATDSIYLLRAGMPVYNTSGLFIDEHELRAHGRDERISAKWFDQGTDFMYELVTAVGR
jgi:acetylornithine deacetylase/succinyl-diaminopimelate desuccinylase-like protein